MTGERGAVWKRSFDHNDAHLGARAQRQEVQPSAQVGGLFLQTYSYWHPRDPGFAGVFYHPPSCMLLLTRLYLQIGVDKMTHLTAFKV
jgi:hypothetical protein